MTSRRSSAALTLSLTGPYERQGRHAAEGVRLWAEASAVQLTVVDDGGSNDRAVQAYDAWVRSTRTDLLLGPYASGLVRAVAPVARDAGVLLWNHGGSADDVAQPGVVAVPAPASSYFHGIVDEASAVGAHRVVVVQGTGGFAQSVAEGALERASKRGMEARAVTLDAVGAESLDSAAVLVAGDFEHDVRTVRAIREQKLALLGAVAAGISAFGEELGEAAEGVLGPVQWWPTDETPEVGPSGSEFAARYRQRIGYQPSYPAAQAAAAGYLAHAALGLGLAAEDLPRWRASTLLGDFALDAGWRQIGHHVTTVRWQDGWMVAVRGPRRGG